MLLVAIQLSVPGLYLPPVLNSWCRYVRPRRSFRCRSTLPCELSAGGHSVVLVAVQLSVLGLYRRRCSNSAAVESAPDNHFIAGPHCRVIISGIRRTVRTGRNPTVGAGMYLPPVFEMLLTPYPPQTIISLPVHTAV